METSLLATRDRPPDVPCMRRIKRPTIGIVTAHDSGALVTLFGCVVAAEAKRLQCGVPELLWIVSMRFDVIRNPCCNDATSSPTQATERLGLKLRLPFELPSICAVQLAHQLVVL